MKALDFFFASRPLLQLPIWTVYLICLQSHLRVSGGHIEWVDVVIIVSLSLIFAGAAYLNQIHDFETDLINRKVGFLQGEILSRQALLRATVPALVLPLAVAPFIGLPTLFIFAQLVLLAYLYSVPPWRLKDRPFGGLLTNAWAHGSLVAFAAVYNITIHSVEVFGWGHPLYFFLTVGGTYLLTTIPDRAGDAAVGKRTLSVVIGKTGTLITAILFFALAAGVAWRSDELILLYLALGALPLTASALITSSEKVVLLAAKLPLLALTLLACWYFPSYFLFLVALLVGTRIYYRRRFGLVYPVLL